MAAPWRPDRDHPLSRSALVGGLARPWRAWASEPGGLSRPAGVWWQATDPRRDRAMAAGLELVDHPRPRRPGLGAGAHACRRLVPRPSSCCWLRLWVAPGPPDWFGRITTPAGCPFGSGAAAGSC